MQATRRRTGWWLAVALGLASAAGSEAACGFFSARGTPIVQPAQQVLLTWDPDEQVETFTVQPAFTGNAADFGMVVPTPSAPKLDPMPADFFKHLAVYTTLKRRAFPESKLLAARPTARDALVGKPSAVTVLDAGVVGSMEYKIIAAERADELYRWLKEHQYHYAGDEATLNHYVQKKWYFTALKLDARKLSKPNGTFAGTVTPTRFQFTSDKLIYPLRMAQVSVKDRLQLRFYVQAPTKMDLPGDNSYLRQGRPLTLLEWAHRLTDTDVELLTGKAPYSEKVPDVDVGFTPADLRDRKRGPAVARAIEARLQKAREQHPHGYLVREAPTAAVQGLQELQGHLQMGRFVTRFSRVFTRDELNDDLLIVPARHGDVLDESEYEEVLPGAAP